MFPTRDFLADLRRPTCSADGATDMVDGCVDSLGTTFQSSQIASSVMMTVYLLILEMVTL